MSTASADGVIYNTASGGDLGSMLSPDNLAKIKTLQASNAFAGGLPTDASGAPDYNAMAAKLLQKGDYSDANNLTQTGLSQQKIRLGFAAANDLANGLQPATGAGAAAPTSGSAAPSLKGANADVVNGIRTIFAAKGINPNVALAAFSAEGLRGFDPNGNANPGDAGSSFGPFQLHYGGVAGGANAVSGLGDDFTKATGLDARDPSTWKQQAEFVANHIAKNGWGAWNGAKRIGITGMMGVGAAPASPPQTAPVQVAQNATTTQSDAPAVGSQHPYGPSPVDNPASTAMADAAPTATGVPAGTGAPAPQAPAGAAATAGDGPQSATDPTLGGLLRGPWVGNPGGYMTALRAKAVSLAATGLSDAATAYNQQATMVENALTRSETPEVKNYAVALRQGYRGTMMDFAADKAAQVKAAELAAEGNPAVIRAKGQSAEATAAGTEQGKVPYELVEVQPTPGGPTMLVPKSQILAGNGAPVKQPAFYGQQQEALGKQQTEMLGQYQQRQMAKERLDAMSNLLETFQSGANADVKAAAVASARSLGFQIPDSATASPASVEQFSKNATANIFAQAKSLGGKVLVSELDGLKKSNANPNMQPASNAAIIAQQRGLLDWQDAHDQAFFAWHQQNPNAYDPSSFEQQWAKENPPSKYVAAAKLNIAPLGVPIPVKSQLVDGQAYMVKGAGGQPVKARWNAAANGFTPVGANH